MIHFDIHAFSSEESYEDVHRRQLEFVDHVITHKSAHLLIGEHAPVITAGKKDADQLPSTVPASIPIFAIERGGNLTLHAPGQLVAYPIFFIGEGNRDLHHLLRTYEEVVIRTVGDFKIEAGRKPGLTGVWVQNRKIASIGIAIRRWVTYHGLALNVTTDLGLFSFIRPCNLDSSVMTSMKQLLDGDEIPIEEVKQSLIHYLSELL